MISINYNNSQYDLKWSNIDELIKFTDYQAHPIVITQHDPLLKKLQQALFLERLSRLMNNFCKLTFSLIDHKDIRKTISVGSGVGTFELLLSQHLTNSEMFLLDKSEFTAVFPITAEKYCSNEHGFYNSWQVTLDAIESSGLDLNKFNFLEPVDEWPSDIDLVVSKGAWCWCFPKEAYWDKMMDSLRIGGTLLLEIPHFNKNYIEEISDQLGCKASVLQNYHISSYPFPNHVKYQSIDDNGYYGAYYMWTRNK